MSVQLNAIPAMDYFHKWIGSGCSLITRISRQLDMEMRSSLHLLLFFALLVTSLFSLSLFFLFTSPFTAQTHHYSAQVMTLVCDDTEFIFNFYLHKVWHNRVLSWDVAISNFTSLFLFLSLNFSLQTGVCGEVLHVTRWHPKRGRMKIVFFVVLPWQVV